MTENVIGSKNLTEDIKLHKAEKPWKPSFKLKRSCEADYGTSVEKKLKRNALCILNKITPEKFELLLKQLDKLDINNEEASNILICLIYEKAMREPIYIVTYVKICKFLAPIKISKRNCQAVDFHTLFLQKCIKEFKKALEDQRNSLYKLEPPAKSYDEETHKQEIWDEQYKTKSRFLGSVKLLGELINQHMLPELTVFNCLLMLRCDHSEVLLEALCLMLKTAGKELLRDKNSVYFNEINAIFQTMQNIVDSHSSSTRIRFLILDVIDLKENNWILRRKEIIPKTIDEIHREALFEERVHEHIQNDKITHSNQNDADQVEIKSKHLIDDFLENRNLEPICQYVCSLLPNKVNIFIKTSLCQVLEESPQNRDSVGELLFQLVIQNIVKIDQYNDGFSGVVEKCKNLALDTPLIWNYLGQIIYPLIKNDQNSFHFLKILLEPYVSSKITEKILSGVFQCIVSKEGSHKAKLLWDELKEELNEVISRCFNLAEITSTLSSNDNDVQNQLLKFFENSEENEKICRWIEMNLPNTADPNFVHALVFASIKNSLIVSTNECRLDEEKFEKSLPLLSTYVNGKTNLELQALNSLQLYVQDLKQPSGLLNHTFEFLHKNKVIAVESFKKWEENVSCSEMESRKITLESVKSFLSQLKEQDP